MSDVNRALTEVLPTLSIPMAAAAIVFMLLWTQQLRRRSLQDEWSAAWADVTERARQEGVPFTTEDSVIDIENRIKRTRELRIRAESRG